jgi:hypothetical protein
MKLLVTLLALCTFSLTNCVGEETIYNKTLRCGATFPTKPKHSIEEGNETYLLEVDSETVYMAMFSRLDDKLDPNNVADVKARFKKMKENVEKAIDGTTTQIKEETFGPNKWPTRYMELKLKDGSVYHTRVVLTRDRIAQAVILGKPAWAGTAAPKKFLSSLKIDD